MYYQVATGRLPARVLAEHLHRHLIERCPECRAAWEALGEGRQAILAMLAGGPPDDPDAGAPGPPSRGGARQGGPRRDAPASPARRDGKGGGHGSGGSCGAAPDVSYGTAFGRAGRRVEAEAARLRDLRRRAERELRLLLATPGAERRRRILGARTRFRSRAFAERLLQEAQNRVRTEPSEAAALAELVPLVVLWTPGALPSPWGDELVIRARAWQANALRVAGDLHRADHEMSLLRRELAGQLLTDDLAGEIDSLEASLRLDQGRFPEAGACLERAIGRLAAADRREDEAKALIKRAELHRLLGRAADALDDAGRALERLDPQHHRVAYLCAVGTQVLALCDLDRPLDARRLLTGHAAAWRTTREPWWSLRLDLYAGRIAYGLGELAAAESAFRGVLERCRERGLAYEAAMTALDLSMALLAQGRPAEVRRLAREAAPVFVHRDLHRETLAALGLFQQAAQAETLTVATIRQLRQSLERAGRRAHPAADA